ncbi:hypothetical protein EIN_079430 [Entamoeba invadens IP1]|uniref:hypothetical protein n=1 Tax=Entamoeba invadens IP1 TaxID=370355 RepID=UPI0002C3D619|nr:hypothetical protein EIN_079430 [Entamoeba invadens IP1]ELP85021.1 hypothetical protein EIN_079430 [Entamoeba invadens IP1]|eukprot:XP_004184367.1 hypothetical protein EIN_079430 [Entamoeba invadens IP1]
MSRQNDHEVVEVNDDDTESQDVELLGVSQNIHNNCESVQTSLNTLRERIDQVQSQLLYDVDNMATNNFTELLSDSSSYFIDDRPNIFSDSELSDDRYDFDFSTRYNPFSIFPNFIRLTQPLTYSPTYFIDGLHSFGPDFSPLQHAEPEVRTVEQIPDWMKQPKKETKPKEKVEKEERKDKSNGLKCAICWDVSDDVVTTQCGHIFCRECMIHLFSNNESVHCPYCRTQLTKKDVHRLFVNE